MNINYKNITFLTIIGVVVVLCGGLSITHVKYTVASLLDQPIQNQNKDNFEVLDSSLLASTLVVAPVTVSNGGVIATNHNNDVSRKVIITTAVIKVIDAPSPLLITTPVNSGISMRLKITKINVDAKIDPMGITQDGAMESPAEAQNVGWFTSGSYPGDSGTAVIAGHYGRWKNGNVSVFDDLNKLKPGDKLYVQDKGGMTITFVVREIKTYDKDEEVSEVFFSNDGKSHLNLIACAGVYIEALKTYSNRLVVFTDKE